MDEHSLFSRSSTEVGGGGGGGGGAFLRSGWISVQHLDVHVQDLQH